MKTTFPVILIAILVSPLANAADLNDSPSSDSSTGKCIKQEKGTPRHGARARAATNVRTPTSAPAPAAPFSRKAAPRSGMGN